MKKSQLDHVLRAARRITGETRFIIIGSQSLHASRPDVPDTILMSIEVDLIAQNERDRTEWLNAIGVDSPFHETFGYYADPVDETTAVVPRGEDRAANARLMRYKYGEGKLIFFFKLAPPPHRHQGQKAMGVAGPKPVRGRKGGIWGCITKKGVVERGFFPARGGGTGGSWGSGVRVDFSRPRPATCRDKGEKSTLTPLIQTPENRSR